MIRKIWLQPLGKFFFGGESSFKEGDEENRRSTYILHSRYYPQQTSVLGLIRNQLLLQNGLLWDNSAHLTDRAKAKALIGGHSFKPTHAGSYGVVQKISPVYLADGQGSAIPPAPRDDVKMNGVSMRFEQRFGRPLLSGFDPKQGLDDLLFIAAGDNVPLKDAFALSEQVGITKIARPDGKDVEENDDEAGYYYQTFLSKSSNSPISGFVFYVEMDDRPDAKLESAIVEFGGERGTFRMTVEDTDLTDFPLPAVAYKHTQVAPVLAKRLLCLSPAYVETAALRSASLLIISQSVSFRFFEAEVETTQHHQALSKNKLVSNGLGESGLYQLLDRGSVVYFDPAQETNLTALFANLPFQNIGYNKYAIL